MPATDIDRIENANLNANLKSLATRVIDDIRRRGMRPGDRYLTASVAGRQFGVSEMSIHRAMQLLADHGYLVRQRGSGTFVGPRLAPSIEQGCPLRVVHVVMSMDYQRTATVPAETLVARLGVSMPETVVEVHYVTEYDATRHLDRIVQGIGELSKSGRADRNSRPDEGIILIRSSRTMQLLAGQCGLPVVVFGGVYPGVRQLPWIDVDQEAVGRLLARHVLQDSPRRLALLMRNDWRQGDNLMARGVIRTLGEAGCRSDVLTILSVPPEPSHIEQSLRELLAEHPVDGVMCRTHLYADVSERVLKETASRSSRPVRVVAGGGSKPATIRHAYVAPEISEEEQVELVGRMLLARAAGPEATVSPRVIPVKLIVP